jgi:hypothetical protein
VAAACSRVCGSLGPQNSLVPPEMPSYLPNEPLAAIVLERYTIQGYLLSSAVYGGIVLLTVLSLQQLWHRRDSNTARHFIFMAFVVVVFCCSTLAAFSSAATVQRQWVDNRNYPGGPLFVLSKTNIAGDIGFTAATWFTDAMMVYRTIVICRSAVPLWLIGSFSGLLYAGSFGDFLRHIRSLSTQC